MTLPLDDLPDDAETLKAMILAARAENARIEAERQRLERDGHVLAAEVDRLTAQAAPDPTVDLPPGEQQHLSDSSS